MPLVGHEMPPRRRHRFDGGQPGGTTGNAGHGVGSAPLVHRMEEGGDGVAGGVQHPGASDVLAVFEHRAELQQCLMAIGRQRVRNSAREQPFADAPRDRRALRAV
jgi:hypothetical protein